MWLSLLLPSTTFNAAAGGANIAITFNICSCCRGSSSHCVSIASSTSASSSKCQEKLHVTLNRASPFPGKYQNILLGDTPGLGICSPRTDIQIPVYLSNRSPLIGIKRTLNSIRLSHANKFYLSWFLLLLLETLSEWMKRNEERKVFRESESSR